MLKRKLFLWIPALVVTAGAVWAQTPKQQYINGLTAALNTVSATYNRNPDQALLFSSNLFLAHGSVIAAFGVETLKAYVDGLRAAGVNRIDINPRVGHWLDTTSPQNASVIEKYDALIAYIRGYGLQLALNPAYSAGDPPFQTFDAWQNAALRAYRELARRYKPDIFVVVHEPTTMAERMGMQTTPQQWRAFAQATAGVVKQESPGSRIGAGGLFTEESYFREMVSAPEVEVATVDIYNLANLADYTRMVEFARQNGKPTYIEETWRPSQQSPGASIGDPDYADLDARWLQVITMYARAVGMEAVTPFWTQSFFAYVPDNDNGMSATYNTAVAQAVSRGQQTPTFQAFQQLTQQWGKKIPVSVSGASFRGPLTPESIASAFGPNLASGTAIASSLPLPTTLGGVSVRIRDSLKVERPAPLFFVTPGQVNYLVPAGVAPGVATVTVTTSSGAVIEGNAFVEPVVPSLFTANSSGQGVAAGLVVRGRADGSRAVELIYQCPAGPGSCTPVAIDLGPESDQVFLLLFGTGIRGRASGGNVSVRIGGQEVPVVYAGPQGEFVGLDQLNVRLTRNLIGRGQVDIVVTVDGKSSLPVLMQIR